MDSILKFISHVHGGFFLYFDRKRKRYEVHRLGIGFIITLRGLISPLRTDISNYMGKYLYFKYIADTQQSK